ncbi:MAG TPA: phage Gp37/Gp68 family protein [Dermatophilaceae bacterium]
MSDKSGIEWTDATWNPTVGCTKVSAGCDHCYAETLVNRFAGTSPAFPTTFDIVNLRSDRFLTQPLRWRKPRRIFVNSLSDLFHKDVPDEFIARVFAVMALAPQHTFQLLTKRHGRMRSLLTSDAFADLFAEALYTVEDPTGREVAEPWAPWPLPNLWLGVSAEDQGTADLRIPALLGTPAAVRFLSCEPLLGPIDLGFTEPCDHVRYSHLDIGCWRAIDWVIAGGESGSHARPMESGWVRSIRDQCATAGIPFLFKQWGGRTPKANGRTLDGRTWDEYPTPSQVTS